jgi:hypothetical protein
MTLGPGAGLAFYSGMSGFYIERFGVPSFYVTMLLCMTLPMPMVAVIQCKYDAWFDVRFSTDMMYSFRVFGMQLGLAGVVLLWMFSTNHPYIVLLVGAMIGFISNGIVSSALQMVASIDPTQIVYAKMGLQVGGFVPVLVFLVHRFEPSSSDAAFRAVLLWEVGICSIAAGTLAYWNMTTDIFSQAYKRLAYDLEDYDETGRLNAVESLARRTTSTFALDPEASKDGIPFWITFWQATIFLMMAGSSYLASLAGYFGSTNMAQTLSLLKLGMELCGRILAFPIPSLPGFTDGPFHKVVAACSVAQLGLICLTFLQLFRTFVPTWVSMTSWCLVFVLGIWTNSLFDVTSGSYVQIRDRKSVARMNQQVIVCGLVVGLLISEAVSYAHIYRTSTIKSADLSDYS